MRYIISQSQQVAGGPIECGYICPDFSVCWMLGFDLLAVLPGWEL